MYFGHELLLVQVWSDNDRAPNESGEFELVDAESGAQIDIALDRKSIAAYTDAFDSYSGEVRHLAESNGGRYAGLSTALSVEEAMFGPAVMGHAGA